MRSARKKNYVERNYFVKIYSNFFMWESKWNARM